MLYTDNGKLKKELVSKLCNVIEKQNVSTEWKFDNLIDIMVNAGEYVSDDTVAEIIDMLLRN